MGGAGFVEGGHVQLHQVFEILPVPWTNLDDVGFQVAVLRARRFRVVANSGSELKIKVWASFEQLAIGPVDSLKLRRNGRCVIYLVGLLPFVKRVEGTQVNGPRAAGDRVVRGVVQRKLRLSHRLDEGAFRFVVGHPALAGLGVFHDHLQVLGR